MKKNLFAYLFLFLTGLLKAQTPGCTDPKATNYNSMATVNDGSCLYAPVTITPINSYTLNPTISETSGLVYYNHYLWTHNDDTDTAIYKLDTLNGAIVQTIPLNGIINTDWEDISQDSNYIYVGDFGNNATGTRTDLHILRISKSSILSGIPVIDTIYFSYSNQSNFISTGANQTDFDCEAFVVTNDSIFLFTKQWLSFKTSIYSLPKLPGTYSAQLKQTCNVQGLITGATVVENKQLIVLSGYSNTLQPFFYLLYDYPQNNFSAGNKRKLSINLPFHQIESVTTNNGLKYYASNENFSNGSILVPQKLHVFNLHSYLQSYLDNSMNTSLQSLTGKTTWSFFPNPAKQQLTVNSDGSMIPDGNYTITNYLGEIVMQSNPGPLNTIDISTLNQGMYIIKMNSSQSPGFKFIKTAD